MFNNIRERFRYFSTIRVAPQDIEHLRTGLFADSTLDINYVVLILGSCAIATLGLLSNSAAVIIGAMIVAPLMLPIRGLAFGALDGDIILVRLGLTAIAVGTLLAIVLSGLLGHLVGLAEFGSEVFSRSKPTLLDLGIAIAAGGIGGFALVHPKVSSSRVPNVLSQREETSAIVFGVVLLTLLIQGLTIKPMLVKLELLSDKAAS